MRKPRVCAVSFLNTAPLVRGMVCGPQRDQVELEFAVPSVCAARVEAGEADAGLVPVIEMERQGLKPVPDWGIACRGPVRSIALVSRVAPERIRTLAADTSSRTSVMLARILLMRKYGAEPAIAAMPADLDAMLDVADAALIIGDPALDLDPVDIGHRYLDLGEEWVEMTGLPMVFAMWAGRPEFVTPALASTLDASARYGLGDLDRLIGEEAAVGRYPRHLIEQYLTRNIVYQLGDEELRGLDLYLRYAREIDTLATETATYDDATGSH